MKTKTLSFSYTCAKIIWLQLLVVEQSIAFWGVQTSTHRHIYTLILLHDWTRAWTGQKQLDYNAFKQLPRQHANPKLVKKWVNADPHPAARAWTSPGNKSSDVAMTLKCLCAGLQLFFVLSALCLYVKTVKRKIFCVLVRMWNCSLWFILITDKYLQRHFGPYYV